MAPFKRLRELEPEPDHTDDEENDVLVGRPLCRRSQRLSQGSQPSEPEVDCQPAAAASKGDKPCNAAGSIHFCMGTTAQGGRLELPRHDACHPRLGRQHLQLGQVGCCLPAHCRPVQPGCWLSRKGLHLAAASVQVDGDQEAQSVDYLLFLWTTRGAVGDGKLRGLREVEGDDADGRQNVLDHQVQAQDRRA
jgi:hypothetical protein